MDSLETWSQVRTVFRLDYIAQDSPRRAMTFVDELIHAGNHLAEFPDTGHAPREMPSGPCREIVPERYRILCRYVDDAIFITSVFHGARQLRARDVEI